MTITETRNGNELTVAVEGRLNAMSSPELEEYLQKNLPGVERLTFDFEKLEFLSSSGLRVLAEVQDILNGNLKIVHVNPDVMSILVEVGFTEWMTIEG